MTTALTIAALVGLFVLFGLFVRGSCDGSGSCGAGACGGQRCTSPDDDTAKPTPRPTDSPSSR